mmetsp:Transcript_16313/g.13981  ORF Transcript_16313/g.13981 Transcript_16313/m.13981 type:complete len:189 (+) Transcript_16313:1177-1743(+)
MRIYSGTLSGKLTLWNATREVLEKPSAILRVRANNYANVRECSAGDIVALAGLKITASGDTLIDAKDDEKIILEGVENPPRVFMAALEYEYIRDKPALENACKNMIREDPSIEVKEDPETGQIIVSGLGELHLEIFRDRLETDYGLKTTLSKMKVAYKESVGEPNNITYEYTKVIKGKPQFLQLDLQI